MKKLFLLLASVTLLAGTSHAAVYDIDASHSQVGFRIRHFVSKVPGSFNDFSGTVNYDPAAPEKMTANVVIKTASVYTANEKRDAHLKTKDFFDVEKYPEMTFKSTKAEKTGENTLKLTGNLTMLGVTKPVTLDVETAGVANDPWGNVRSGFSAKGKLNRKDYGMVFNMAADKGGFVLGDEVDVVIEIEGVSKQAKK